MIITSLILQTADAIVSKLKYPIEIAPDQLLRERVYAHAFARLDLSEVISTILSV